MDIVKEHAQLFHSDHPITNNWPMLSIFTLFFTRLTPTGKILCKAFHRKFLILGMNLVFHKPFQVSVEILINNEEILLAPSDSMVIGYDRQT